MKTVGIIGGLSPESTVTYYRWINEGVRRLFGGLSSAKIILSSVDFSKFSTLPEDGEWSEYGEMLADEAKKLELAGADFIALATNTFHHVEHQIVQNLNVPFLSILDCVAERLVKEEIFKAGLLGTSHTMRLPFYKTRLENFGINTLVPDESEAGAISEIIYTELCTGKVTQQSKELYKKTISKMKTRGAQGVILGCTEINLLVNASDTELSVIDSTESHVEAIIKELAAQA